MCASYSRARLESKTARSFRAAIGFLFSLVPLSLAVSLSIFVFGELFSHFPGYIYIYIFIFAAFVCVPFCTRLQALCRALCNCIIIRMEECVCVCGFSLNIFSLCHWSMNRSRVEIGNGTYKTIL